MIAIGAAVSSLEEAGASLAILGSFTSISSFQEADPWL
jgi:hypothetical protein